MIIKFQKEQKKIKLPQNCFFEVAKGNSCLPLLSSGHFDQQVRGLAFIQQPSVRTCSGVFSPGQCSCSGHDYLQETGQAAEVGTSSISAVFARAMMFSSDLFSPTPPHVISVLQLPQILHSAWIFMLLSPLAYFSSGICLFTWPLIHFCLHYDISCMCGFPDPAP